MAESKTVQSTGKENGDGSKVRRRRKGTDNSRFLERDEMSELKSPVIEKREVVAYEHEYMLIDIHGNTSKLTSLSMLDWEEYSDLRSECEGVSAVRQLCSHSLIRANEFELEVNDIVDEE